VVENRPAMKRLLIVLSLFVCTAALSACSGSAVSPVVQSHPGAAASRAGSVASSKRIIYYYQTQYNNGVYVSLAPVWKTKNPNTGMPYTTDVIVAAFHLGYDLNGQPYIHLNDNVPGDPMFDVMWPQVHRLQNLGVTTRMMLGGAAQGSYADLFAHWTTFYPILRHTLKHYRLNGIDLDVEENVTLPQIERLINKLHTDFGPTFEITLAPVSSALTNGANLSGFSYPELYSSKVGPDIAWFDTQFYSGFGTLSSTIDYTNVINFGYPPDVVVAGMIANPFDGSGFVAMGTVENTVTSLVGTYPTFGGVFAWEYFNALPGGTAKPGEWSQAFGQAMGL
jgi:hypothetical protein